MFTYDHEDIYEALSSGDKDFFYNAIVNWGSDPYLAEEQIVVEETYNFMNEDGTTIGDIHFGDVDFGEWEMLCRRLDLDPWSTDVIHTGGKWNEEGYSFVLSTEYLIELNGHLRIKDEDAEMWFERLYKEDEDIAAKFYNKLPEEQRKRIRIYGVCHDTMELNSPDNTITEIRTKLSFADAVEEANELAKSPEYKAMGGTLFVSTGIYTEDLYSVNVIKQ